jgi:hypothetical protein
MLSASLPMIRAPLVFKVDTRVDTFHTLKMVKATPFVSVVLIAVEATDIPNIRDD